MNNYREFTYEQIAAVFEYDPDTGELWRRLPHGEVRPMTMAREYRDRGSVAAYVTFAGHSIVVTHICFMLVEHRWPKPRHHIDHKDGDVFNCRRNNLREATYRQHGEWSFEASRKPEG